jgi:membrane associated rhomboid family serine protease
MFAIKVISGTIAGASGGVFSIFGVFFGNLILNYSDSTHGLIPRWARLMMIILLMTIEFLIRALLPNPENSVAQHAAGFALGCLFSVVVIRNISNTHFERTYLVPAATWTLSAFLIFAVGW